jgi:hypothetical protein
LRSSGGSKAAAVADDDADMKEEPTGVDAIAQVLAASSVHSAATAVEVTLHERTQKRSSLDSSTGSLTAAAATAADDSAHSESGIEMAQRSPQQSDAAAVTPHARGAAGSTAAVAHDAGSNGYSASSQQQQQQLREYSDVEAAFGTAAVQPSSAPTSPRRAMHRASISHQFLNLLGRSKHGPDAAARKAALPHSTVHGQSSISRVNSERSSAGTGASGWGGGRVGWGSQHHQPQQQQGQQPAVASLAGEGKAAAAVRRRHLHHHRHAASGESTDEAGSSGPDVITVVNHHWEVVRLLIACKSLQHCAKACSAV